MELLRRAISAAGGCEQWREVSGFTAHMTIGGDLIGRKFRPEALKEIAVDADASERIVRITGLDSEDDRFFCRADQVGVEDENGNIIRVERRSFEDWERRAPEVSWDILDVVQYCGYSVWSYVATPYLLQSTGLRCVDQPHEHPIERTRSVCVEFPRAAMAYPLLQTLHFDAQGLLVRMDYEAVELDGAIVSQSVGAHQNFSGYLVPTLRRSRLIGSKYTSAAPALLDIEIFDLDIRRR
jgi:hypothetical protein